MSINGKTINLIIQARMGSTRLPGKVLLDIMGKPALEHIVERVSQSKLIDQIVIATSISVQDDVLAETVMKWGIGCFRGHEMDVLHRFYNASQQYSSAYVVRVTADCPLIDPFIIDKVIEACITQNVRYATNAGGDDDKRTFPRGLDCEVFTAELLQQAFFSANEPYEREHVTPFMYWKQDSIFHVTNDVDLSYLRWTLDTKEDFNLINEVYHNLYKGKHDFYMNDILRLINNNPEILLLNNMIKQKEVRIHENQE